MESLDGPCLMYRSENDQVGFAKNAVDADCSAAESDGPKCFGQKGLVAVLETEGRGEDLTPRGGLANLVAGDLYAIVFPVMFDNADERWREHEGSESVLTEEGFDDFPLGWPRTVLTDTRQLRPMSTDWLQHHDGLARRSGVRSADRSIHENLSLYAEFCTGSHAMTNSTLLVWRVVRP